MPLAFLVLHTLRAFERITRGLPNVGRFLGCGNRALFAVAPFGRCVHWALLSSSSTRLLAGMSFGRSSYSDAVPERFAHAFRLQ